MRALTEHAVPGGGSLAQRHRFRQRARSAEGGRGSQHVDLPGLAPAGNGDDLRPTTLGAQVQNELESIPLGHEDVQDDDVRASRAVEPKTGGAVARFDYLLARPLQRPPDRAAKTGIVINQQYARPGLRLAWDQPCRGSTSRGRVEHFTDLARETLRREGLLEV